MSEEDGVKSQARPDATSSRATSATPARDDAARGNADGTERPRNDATSDELPRDDARSDDAESGDATSNELHRDDARSGDAESDDAESNELHRDDARSDDATSDDARSDDATSGDAESNELHRDDAESNELHRDDDGSHDAVFEALWRRAVEAWDDERPHVAILDHALKNQKLPELAGRYRSLKDDPEKSVRAQKKLDGIVVAATQMLMATRTPPRTKTPWQWSAAAALMFAIVCAFLFYQLFVPHR